jgi:hypothetical protein
MQTRLWRMTRHIKEVINLFIYLEKFYGFNLPDQKSYLFKLTRRSCRIQQSIVNSTGVHWRDISVHFMKVWDVVPSALHCGLGGDDGAGGS